MMNPSTFALGITITHGHLHYRGNTAPTLHDLSLTLPKGQWSCLLGRSGCGKTSLLRYLAGLLSEDAHWQGQTAVSDGKPLDGRIAYMAQQDLLLPWLNVLDNVCLERRLTDTLTQDDLTRAHQLLEQVGLAEHAQDKPSQLSGGMRQRVALARTLMQDRPVVLMDEPFSALDAVTRYKLQTLAAQLLKDRTVVLITHDPQEAIRLAHKLYVMQGTPAHCIELDLPNTLPPRKIDAASAQLQQTILEQLEHDYA
ncbi:ABC transporter ATP-binding protein [Vibrio agarilyticus]|nr:ABC transporter ATP-binding protein [Vibrio agarilyticus]